MRYVRLVGLAWALAVAAAVSVAPAGAARAAGDELETRTVSAYTVAADGSVHVTIAAHIVNRDPTTERRNSGRVFFYTTAGFAIHDAASNLVARSGGNRLTVEPRDRDEPLRLVAVRFDRDLYYSESIDLTLEYDLSAVRAAQLLVGPQYAFVPAIGQGSRSLVRISAPADRQLTIASANCARTADQPVVYACGASTTAADYQAGGRCAFTLTAPRWDCAFTEQDLTVIPFEVSGRSLTRATRTRNVALGSGALEVRVQYFAGDEAWAARVEDLARQSLPLLEEANGFPYSGPRVVEIVESGYRDTNGYEGLANSRGGIRLTPVVDDQTVLHELAHLWSGVFASRWLAEGMADYTATLVARRLGISVEPVREPLPSAPRLEEWGPLRSQIAVSKSERDREEAGYARSLRFVELLAGRLGPGALGTANAALDREDQRATARTYLDLLEEQTRQPLAPLFGEWALTEADAALLPARAETRGALAALRGRAASVGLAVPADVDAAVRDWSFARAGQLIGTAASALDAYERTLMEARAAGLELGPGGQTAFARSAADGAAAVEQQAAAVSALSAAIIRLREARSPMMRLGLLGTDLSDQEAAGRAALAAGDAVDAAARAAIITHRLDTAGRDGMLRAGASVAAVGLLAVAVLWRTRRGTRRLLAVQAERPSRPPSLRGKGEA